MRIRLNLNQNSYYEIPKSIFLFLQEKYDNEICIEFLNFFIKFLKKEHKINFFENYSKKDLSEIVQKKFDKELIFDPKLNEKVTEIFIQFLENSFDKLLLLTEFHKYLKNVDLDFDGYEKLFIYHKNATEQIEEKFSKSAPEEILVEFEKLDKEESLEPQSSVPDHEWDGTKLRFRFSNGKWGKWVELAPLAPIPSGGGGGLGRRKIQGMIDSSIEDALADLPPGNVSFGSGSSTIDANNNFVGISNNVAREDHVHFHGNLTGGFLHNTATLSLSGFMSFNDKINLNNLSSSYNALSSSLSASVLTNILTSSHLTASTGTLHVATASYLSSTVLTVESLIALNTNITASIGDPLSGNTGRFDNLSSSYFEFISGNINRLTASSLSSTLDLQTLNITGSFLTASTGTLNILTATYISSTNLFLTGVSNVSPVRGRITNTNFSCSASGTQLIPLLSQSMSPGEMWQISANLFVVLTGTGGVRFTIFAPTGSVIQGFIHGKTTTQNTDSRPRIGAINTEVATTLNGATLLQMPQEMYFTVRNGANAGDIKIGVRRVTATDFCHIVSGSYMIATKCTIGD